jgi:hypothetical protein
VLWGRRVWKVGRKYIVACEACNVLSWSVFFLIRAFPVSRIDFCFYTSSHLIFQTYVPVACQTSEPQPSISYILCFRNRSRTYTYIYTYWVWKRNDQYIWKILKAPCLAPMFSRTDTVYRMTCAFWPIYISTKLYIPFHIYSSPTCPFWVLLISLSP